MGVCAGKASEVSTVSEPDTSDEECCDRLLPAHLNLIRYRAGVRLGLGILLIRLDGEYGTEVAGREQDDGQESRCRGERAGVLHTVTVHGLMLPSERLRVK